MITARFVSSRSATFELGGEGVYFAPAPFDVFLDGTLRLEKVSTNVFSVFGLSPDSAYVLRAAEEVCRFRTRPETAFLDVRDFGARGDGITDDSSALQAAILSCPAGGTVFLPEGIFRSSPLFLKSGVTVHLAETAVLLGETDRGRYPILPASLPSPDGSEDPLGSWEGEPKPIYASLITGIGVHDAAVTGCGRIDGNAQNGDWWAHPREAVGGAFRPRGIFLSHCENVVLQGFTLANSPSWNLHPHHSSGIDVLSLRIESPKDSPNTDGCDPESCDGVRILGVDFSVGDDCIALKSGRYGPGCPRLVPCQNVTIRNCRMAFGHGGVVLGSESSGGIRGLSVSRCLFQNTDRGLRIKTRRGRGRFGVIDGVTFENIRMEGVLTPLVINMFYFCDPDGKTEYVWSKSPLPVDDRTPVLGRFVFKDIVCTDAHAAAGFFAGLPESPIGGITLENVFVRFAERAVPSVPAMMSFLEPMAKKGFLFHNVSAVSVKNVRLEGAEGDPFVLEGVGSFEKA